MSSPNITNDTTGHLDYFCRESPVTTAVWAAVAVLCSVVGLPCSLWLLWIQLHKGCQVLTNDVYLLNITAMDFIANSFNIPGVINLYVWRLIPLSQVTSFLTAVSVHGRPLITALGCVDCYLAVVHPIVYMRMKQTWYRLVANAFAWLFTLVLAYVLVLEIANSYPSLLVLPYVLSLPIIAFCNVSILLALRRPDPSGRSKVHPQKQRAMQTVTNSFVMCVVAYLPPMAFFGFASLISLPIQRLWCDVMTPVLIAPMLGSTILPLLHLQNLGYLKGCKQMCQK